MSKHIEPMQFYTEEGYKFFDESSSNSAQELVPLIMKLIKPKTVVDVGCGTGNWLSVFKEYGVEILGIDGEHVSLEMLKIPPECFRTHDLNKPLQLQQDFDLVVSLEVAEHLTEDKAEQFVQALINLGPVILFSAAIPNQPGYHHVNCQWPEYWANIFRRNGYRVIDCFRMKIWQNYNVDWWYSQNLFLYVKESCLENYPLILQENQNSNPPLLPLVHPQLYLKTQHDYQSLQDRWNPNNVTVSRVFRLLASVMKAKFSKIHQRL